MGDSSGFFQNLEPKELQKQLKHVSFYLKWLDFGKATIAVIVVCLIAVVVLVPLFQPDEEGFRIPITQDTEELVTIEKPVMKNPRYESVDNDNHPYTVRAREAIQLDEESVQLNIINADIELDNRLWMALTADTGRFLIDGQVLDLHNHVQLIANNGYELRTSYALVNMKQGKIKGNKGVEGQGQLGYIKADNFLFEADAKRVLFTDNVTMKIYP